MGCGLMLKKNRGTALHFKGTHVSMGQSQLHLKAASLKVTLRVPLTGQRLEDVSGVRSVPGE